jgi:hypothetical protein
MTFLCAEHSAYDSSPSKRGYADEYFWLDLVVRAKNPSAVAAALNNQSRAIPTNGWCSARRDQFWCASNS